MLSSVFFNFPANPAKKLLINVIGTKEPGIDFSFGRTRKICHNIWRTKLCMGEPARWSKGIEAQILDEFIVEETE